MRDAARLIKRHVHLNNEPPATPPPPSVCSAFKARVFRTEFRWASLPVASPPLRSIHLQADLVATPPPSLPPLSLRGNPLRPVFAGRSYVRQLSFENTKTVLNTLLRDEKWKLPVRRTTCVHPRIHFSEPFLRDSNYSGKLRSFISDLPAILAIRTLARFLSRRLPRFWLSSTIIFAISRGIR